MQFTEAELKEEYKKIKSLNILDLENDIFKLEKENKKLSKSKNPKHKERIILNSYSINIKKTQLKVLKDINDSEVIGEYFE